MYCHLFYGSQCITASTCRTVWWRKHLPFTLCTSGSPYWLLIIIIDSELFPCFVNRINISLNEAGSTLISSFIRIYRSLSACFVLLNSSVHYTWPTPTYPSFLPRCIYAGAVQRWAKCLCVCRSVCPSVRPSVCQTRECDKTKESFAHIFISQGRWMHLGLHVVLRYEKWFVGMPPSTYNCGPKWLSSKTAISNLYSLVAPQL